MLLGTKKSFTLMELMIVVVIFGAIATFALPRYTETLERSYEADAINQMRSIHAANRILNIKTGSFWPPDAGPYADINVINTQLALNIYENGVTYSCAGTNGTTFKCTAQRGGNFTLGVIELPLANDGPAGQQDNPCCDAGNCPTIAEACP